MRFNSDNLKYHGLALASVFVPVLTFPSVAFAQSIFCPADVSGVSQRVYGDGFPDRTQPYSLQNGRCTNGRDGSGAFSGAALASQALTGLSQSTTTETNRTTSNAIANRREEEASRPRESQIQTRPQDTQVDRNEDPDRRRRQAARRSNARAVAQDRRARRAETSDRAALRLSDIRGRRPVERPVIDQPTRIRPLVSKDEAITPQAYTVIPEVARYGAWAQGFGDFEQRSGRLNSFIAYDPRFIAGATDFQFQLTQKSTTRSVGFLGGIDITKRDISSAGDGLILGVMTGYTDTSVDILSRISFSLVPFNGRTPPSGSARTRVSLYGPSIGAYATYFYNGFSFDQVLKADFFALDQRFSESGSFVGRAFFFDPNSIGSIVGSGQTGVIQLSSVGNVNYRIPMASNLWLEPTVGYQYIHSFYDNNAGALGLRDGDLVRVQGGLRIGYQGLLGSNLLTVTLTGLAYNNVLINGGFIQSGAFGSNVLALNDEGKTRGEGILTASLDHGNGLSTFIQGNVRGGDRYFGAGGRAGVRYQW